MNNKQAESVVYVLFIPVLAAIAIPAAVYLLSFGWLTQGVVGVVLAGVALALCLSPLLSAGLAYWSWSKGATPA